MRAVVLAKAVRLAAGSPMLKAGQTVEIDDDTFERLSALNAIHIGDDTDELKQTPPAQESTNEAIDRQVIAERVDSPVDGYPPLPKKTAPVAEWKEYARANDIKLTGLSKRNEIVGFVTKVVDKT